MTGTTFSSPSSYWQVSRAPRYSLLLALPLLVFYQVLALLLAHGERSIRNGADVILQALFTAAAGAWGPPLFMVCLIGGGVWARVRDTPAPLHPPPQRLDPHGGGRVPAGLVHGGGGGVGPAALHGLPDRRGVVARHARHARPRIAAPGRRVRRDAGRVDRARADLRLRGGERDLGGARHAADPRPPRRGRPRDGLVDPADALAGGGDLRGAAVPRPARGRARRRRARPPRLAPAHRRHRGDPRRRRDLLGVPLYRPVRRPLAAVLVRVPNGRGAVLFGVVSRARVWHHGVDARVVRRAASPDAIIRAPLARSPALTGGPPSLPALTGGAMRHCAPIAIGPALTGGAMTADAISGTVMQQTDPRGPVLHHQRLAMRHTFVM